MGHPTDTVSKGNYGEVGPGFSLSVMNALPADVLLSKLYLAMLWNWERKRCADRAYEKMLNIANQENVNHTHNEILP